MPFPQGSNVVTTTPREPAARIHYEFDDINILRRMRKLIAERARAERPPRQARHRAWMPLIPKLKAGLARGESMRALSRTFGIPEATIRSLKKRGIL